MDRAENHLKWIAPVAAVLILIGIVALMALATYAVLSQPNAAAELRKDLINNVAGNFGVPAAALAAFVLVLVLWSRFPPSYLEGEVKLEILSLRFSGPSGPISLWVVCFLSFIFAIWLLKLPRSGVDPDQIISGAKQQHADAAQQTGAADRREDAAPADR